MSAATLTPTPTQPIAPRSTAAPRRPRFTRSVLIATPRVLSTPKYMPRLQRRLRALYRPFFADDLLEAIQRNLLPGARVELVRVHPALRRDDGTRLRRLTRRRARQLLREGRLLSRDVRVLLEGLEALSAGAKLVRLGTPRSLNEANATEIQ